jgi:hypothetical protein
MPRRKIYTTAKGSCDSAFSTLPLTLQQWLSKLLVSERGESWHIPHLTRDGVNRMLFNKLSENEPGVWVIAISTSGLPWQ